MQFPVTMSKTTVKVNTVNMEAFSQSQGLIAKQQQLYYWFCQTLLLFKRSFPFFTDMKRFS